MRIHMESLIFEVTLNIALLVLAKRVLEKCIDLLGFEAPERM